jgi:4,5:9,10-diseco-3-hydroxy-5,9,17-trioxoandrosta-1(10),2-diene-4-oate hydrolase
MSFPEGDPHYAARFISLRSGYSIRVVERGFAGAPPIVLLSGWGCSAYLFRHNMPALATAGFRVIAVETIGSGESDKPLDPSKYTRESLVSHVCDILDALGLDSVTLVGQSLGGGIAAHFALSHAARVERLVLVAPVNFGRVHFVSPARALNLAIGVPHLPTSVLRLITSCLLRLVYGKHGSPTARDVDEYLAPNAHPEFVRAQQLLIRKFDWRPMDDSSVARLSQPILVIYGTHDRFVSRAGMDRLTRLAPNVRLHVVDGAGHAPNEESPEHVNRAIARFLGGVDGRTS